jgi:hypothetical protein
MTFFSWLRRRMAVQLQTRCAPARRPTPRFGPRIEALEGLDVPSTLTVTSAGDTGTGTLRYEIAAAHSGDTIVFAPGLAGKTITEVYGELVIGKDLTIQGLGATELAVSGGHANRVFEVLAGAHVAVSGLTVEFGRFTTSFPDHGALGGGFLNLGALTLSGCTVRSNEASVGGGIYNGGTLTLNGCKVSRNSSNEGAGIYNVGTLTVSTSAFSGNTPDNIHGSYTDGGGNTFS